MFRFIPDLLDAAQIAEVRDCIKSANYVDGKISNPHSKVKSNLHLHDIEAYEKSSKIMLDALNAHEDFRNFAFPAAIAPPLITRYDKGMYYGAHTDAPFIPLPTGPQRTDVSCTIFLNDPASYQGGALCIAMGDAKMRFKGTPGSAIVYPSTTMHEVEAVTSGERLVAISFIQSRIADQSKRHLLYELNEVAALEGLSMVPENFRRIQGVQSNLTRMWSDS